MDIVVTPSGDLQWRGHRIRCALGKGGRTHDKREGDGATPIGRWPLRRVFYRPDRIDTPTTSLSVVKIGESDGWCDDPRDPHYNTLVRLPHDGHHEVMWREDHIYDIVVELGYNDNPPVSGRGSAIFMHVARDGYSPTEGCVALALDDLLKLLSHCNKGDAVVVTPAS